MRKWFPLSLLLFSATLIQAQWTQAPAYPQAPSQYPQSQYPQSQYPENAPPAQNQDPQGQAAYDVPDQADLQHGVARVSIAQGDVNIRRGDNGQLTATIINTPLLTHDHLQTSPGSRAEVQLDAATLIRLGPDTDLAFADLQFQRAQIQLGLGTIIFRVLPNAATQVEIDTPSIGIRALTQGEYRISVFDNGTSQITVRSGQLELSGPHGTERLDAGRSVMVRGDASNPEMQTLAEAPRDQFDDWSAGLPSEAPAPQSYQYVNADVQGAADLDRYGNWVPSGYGQAWRPQGVAADWSPYSDGQWSYVDYYGWSWIDYSPWGWAPYHYGRWFNNPGYGWCWWPGARGYRSYWSPAMVGFFGFGSGLGWVALAPYEHFHPWWGRGGSGYGFGYRNGFGVGSYRNAAFRGGALTASFNSFGSPHQRYFAATRGQLSSASVINGRLPVTASRASYSYSTRAAVPNSRFAATQSRTFFHSSSASSFNSRSNSYSSTSSAGWQHFGTPGVTSSRQNFQSSETSGWHGFGNTNRYQAAPRTSAAPTYQQQPRYSYQPQQSAPRTYSQPRSYSQPSYQQPHYSAPSAQRQSQPQQHYSAPVPRSGGGGGNNGGGSHSSGGGGGSHSSGGGGGHHGR